MNVPVTIWDALQLKGVPSPDPGAAALYVYLVTCPETLRIPGVVRAGRAALSEALGWELEAFMHAFDVLERAGLAMADWPARLVFLPEPLTWESSRPQSTGPAVCWRKEMANIPPCDLARRIDADVRTVLSRLSPAFLTSYEENRRTDLPARAPSAERESDDTAAGVGAVAVVGTDHLPGKQPGRLPRSLRAARKQAAKAATAASPDALAVLAALNEARIRVIDGAKELRPTSSNLAEISARLLEHSVDELKHVIAVVEAEVKADRKQEQWFDAVTPFRTSNFSRKLARTVDMAVAAAPAPPKDVAPNRPPLADQLSYGDGK